MPQNSTLAAKQWERYVYCRDMGHIQYVDKSRKCEDFFAGFPGLQWDPSVLNELRDQRRPGLTINKILGTLSSIMGEQIDLRHEIAFKSRFGAASTNADILMGTFKFIGDRNQLDWRRSEMFADGAITSRGYLDVRMNFDRSITGDIEITNLNPRNVIPDPDAQEYDPDEWNDVIVTRWLTIDEIEYLYNAEDAKALRGRAPSAWSYGFDSTDRLRDSFGQPGLAVNTGFHDTDDHVQRMVRVIDRQYKILTRVKYFVNMQNGDKKLIPHTWDDEKIAAMLAQQQGRVQVMETKGKRIRWTVTADDYVLHDKWSPYKHFTVVPYFPYFRYGRTIGLVENLIDPQELLNKTTSQELHIVNSMANSGWKIKTNALKNMTMDELEQYGSKTGVVLELDDVDNAEKITPNSVPQGLDRLSQKGENYIKSVSMRGDAQMGMTRADVSADQIEANNAFSDVGLRKPMDNLKRTDHILARNMLDLVQEYYTDPRIMTITHNALTGETKDVQINWPSVETGEIQNDLSMGEYDITIVSQPAKATLEDSQFEQAAYMREKLGVKIPDEFLVENSRLVNKTSLVAAIKAEKESPEAQAQAQIQLLGQQLQVAELKAQVAKDEADALHRRAKSAKEMAETQEILSGKPEEQAKAEQEMAIEAQRHQQEMEQMREKHAMELQIQREKAAADIEAKKMMAVEEARLKRAQAIMAERQKATAQPVGKKAA